MGCLPWRDAEELRVELIQPLNEPAPLGNRLPRQSRFRIVKPLHVPTVRRHVGDRFTALDEQFPKRFGIVDATRETAANSNNRDSFSLHRSGHNICDTRYIKPSLSWKRV